MAFFSAFLLIFTNLTTCIEERFQVPADTSENIAFYEQIPMRDGFHFSGNLQNPADLSIAINENSHNYSLHLLRKS